MKTKVTSKFYNRLLFLFLGIILIVGILSIVQYFTMPTMPTLEEQLQNKLYQIKYRDNELFNVTVDWQTRLNFLQLYKIEGYDVIVGGNLTSHTITVFYEDNNKFTHILLHITPQFDNQKQKQLKITNGTTVGSYTCEYSDCDEIIVHMLSKQPLIKRAFCK